MAKRYFQAQLGPARKKITQLSDWPRSHLTNKKNSPAIGKLGSSWEKLWVWSNSSQLEPSGKPNDTQLGPSSKLDLGVPHSLARALALCSNERLALETSAITTWPPWHYWRMVGSPHKYIYSFIIRIQYICIYLNIFVLLHQEKFPLTNFL